MRSPEITQNIPLDGRAIVGEGGSIVLSCKAIGNPQPKIKWQRSDGQKMNIRGKNGGAAESK